MTQNPFIVQRPIKYGEPFCNRKNEIEQLIRAAERSEAICILSIRRFGKASLVNQALGQLEDQGWLTLRVDMSRCFSTDSLARELEKGLYLLAGKWKRLVDELKAVSRLRLQFSSLFRRNRPAIPKLSGHLFCLRRH